MRSFCWRSSLHNRVLLWYDVSQKYDPMETQILLCSNLKRAYKSPKTAIFLVLVTKVDFRITFDKTESWWLLTNEIKKLSEKIFWRNVAVFGDSGVFHCSYLWISSYQRRTLELSCECCCSNNPKTTESAPPPPPFEKYLFWKFSIIRRQTKDPNILKHLFLFLGDYYLTGDRARQVLC